MFDKNGDKIIGGLIQRVLIDMPYQLTRVDPPKHTKACDDSHAAVRKKRGEAWPRGQCSCPRATKQVTPTVEAMVRQVVAHPIYGEVAECVNTASHGTHTAKASSITVMRGDTKDSRDFRAYLEERAGRRPPKRRGDTE
jgi:hypothetical protein